MAGTSRDVGGYYLATPFSSSTSQAAIFGRANTPCRYRRSPLPSCDSFTIPFADSRATRASPYELHTLWAWKNVFAWTTTTLLPSGAAPTRHYGRTGVWCMVEGRTSHQWRGGNYSDIKHLPDTATLRAVRAAAHTRASCTMVDLWRDGQDKLPTPARTTIRHLLFA